MGDRNPFLDRDREFGSDVDPEQAYAKFVREQEVERAKQGKKNPKPGTLPESQSVLGDQAEKPEILASKTLHRAGTSGFIKSEEWLILEGRQHGNYEYPDLLVDTGKLTREDFLYNFPPYLINGRLSSLFSREEIFDITYEAITSSGPPSKRIDPYDFVGYMDWNQAHQVLNANGAFMLNIRQFLDFINLLKSGKAYSGDGKPVHENFLSDVLDDILSPDLKLIRGERASGEHLDARFEKVNDEFHIIYHNIKPPSVLQEVREPLRSSLEGFTTTNLDDLLTYADQHGLPRRGVPKTNIHIPPLNDAVLLFNYHPPLDGSVSIFVSSFSHPYENHNLACYYPPSYFKPYIGVRAAILKP